MALNAFSSETSVRMNRAAMYIVQYEKSYPISKLLPLGTELTTLEKLSVITYSNTALSHVQPLLNLLFT